MKQICGFILIVVLVFLCGCNANKNSDIKELTTLSVNPESVNKETIRMSEIAKSATCVSLETNILLLLLWMISLKYILMIKNIPLILILLLCACSNSTSNRDHLLSVDFEGGNTGLSLDSFEFKFIALETIDSCLLGDIGQIEIRNDRIYIIDRTNDLIFVFSIEGAFITQIGAKGNGPGEYVMPKTLHIDEKKRVISVLDVAQGKMIHYDMETYQYISNQKNKEL